MNKKCTGAGCDLKLKCNRFVSGVSNYIDFYPRPPFKINKGMFDCDYFIGDKADLIFVQLTGISSEKYKSVKLNSEEFNVIKKRVQKKIKERLK